MARNRKADSVPLAKETFRKFEFEPLEELVRLYQSEIVLTNKRPRIHRFKRC